jgi:hypothetical protein
MVLLYVNFNITTLILLALTSQASFNNLEGPLFNISNLPRLGTVYVKSYIYLSRSFLTNLILQ